MLKLSRLPIALLALTVAVPVLAAETAPGQNATPPTMVKPQATTSAAVEKKAEPVDINSATTAELQALPGLTDSDAGKIVKGRPYTGTDQLVSKHIVSEATYAKLKDHIVAKAPKS